MEAFDQIQGLKPPEGWEILAPFAAVLLADDSLRTVQQDADIQAGVQRLLSYKEENLSSFQTVHTGITRIFEDLPLVTRAELLAANKKQMANEQGKITDDLGLLPRLQAWESFLVAPVGADPIPYLCNALDKAFGYRIYQDEVAYPEEVDDLASRLAEVQQIAAFYQYHDRLRAVVRYSDPDFTNSLPADPALTSIKNALKQTQMLLTDTKKLRQFITSEVSLLNELLEPAEEVIKSYGVRYLQLFDQVTAHTEQIRQQIKTLPQHQTYLALTRLAQVTALGADPRPGLEQAWTQAVASPPELFPRTLTHNKVKQELNAMPQPPGCPLTMQNAGDWLQRADDALKQAETRLRLALQDKAALLHSEALRERLKQGQNEPFIARLLATQSVTDMATYLTQTLGGADMSKPDPISLLNRFLKQIQIRKLRLTDFKPGKQTIEAADVDQIVSEFHQFLLAALRTDSDDELPVLELE